MKNKFHPFHMVEMSPWPLLTSTALLFLTTSIISWLTTKNIFMMSMMVLIVSSLSFMWWKDVAREAKNQGFHSTAVMQGMKMGMVLFIASEVLFFTSFFWSFFHSSVSPNIEMGQMWPPVPIKSFNPMNVPLLNTIILISSGVSVTWAHHCIIKNNYKKSVKSMVLTVILGIYFSMLQGLEYMEAEFSMSDSIYGSSFFMSTGFHGIHVIIGTTFLATCTIRMMKKQISSKHMVGFEMAAWYWHFVDVVWLMLYTFMYWWGA
uniref:cytochrome c oxidase subunit III n=1 Tax=Halotydeus destructor TaxID=2874060 RepID=UPI002027D52D|nr:cytochrome c oxidase subunit III [Halotydeus destructor]UPN63256.1 cytochrome oxidase subunit 3 [Halotydeus destructor]